MATIEKRKSKDGLITHRAKVRLKGYPHANATFDRLSDARRWVQQTEAAIREGRYFKTSEAKKHTMAETIDRYISEVLSHEKANAVNKEHYLNTWKKRIGGYSLIDITPSLIVEHRNQLVGSKNKVGREIRPSTVNRYVQALSHLLNIAKNEWEWMSSNPVQKISKYKEPRGRVRFLSDEERSSLLEACKKSFNPYLYTVVVLALSTGARKMEILGLKWKDVDLKLHRIVLHETKNGDRRVLPLQGHAFSLMESYHKIRQTNCDYVFPSNVKCQPMDVRKSFENAVKNAGVEDFRFHDLRHSAASYLAMNGATLSEIAEVLGHKSLEMVKRYSHISEPHTAKVISDMNEKIFDGAS